MRLLEWLTKNGFGVTMSIVGILLAAGLAGLLTQPSPWRRSHYNDCLEIVLRSGNIADAEMMCAKLKDKL